MTMALAQGLLLMSTSAARARVVRKYLPRKFTMSNIQAFGKLNARRWLQKQHRKAAKQTQTSSGLRWTPDHSSGGRSFSSSCKCTSTVWPWTAGTCTEAKTKQVNWLHTFGQASMTRLASRNLVFNVASLLSMKAASARKPWQAGKILQIHYFAVPWRRTPSPSWRQGSTPRSPEALHPVEDIAHGLLRLRPLPT